MIKIDVEVIGDRVIPIVTFSGNGNLHSFSMYSMKDIGNNREQAFLYAKEFMQCLRREIKHLKKRKGAKR